MTVMEGAAVFAQAIGAFAVLVGLFLLLPLGWFLVAGGVLLVLLAVAVEVAQRRRAVTGDGPR